MPFTESQRQRLLDIARASIRHGLDKGSPMEVDAGAEEPTLREERATFVTLERRGQLRGCIGTLDARYPVAVDVALRAYESAFEDPRFPPLEESEWEDLHIHISVLTPPVEIPGLSNEADLLAALRPGIDGLVLSDGRRRATFLPSVWEDLSDPVEFVAHLKAKGGWRAGEWPKGMKALRYESESIP